MTRSAALPPRRALRLAYRLGAGALLLAIAAGAARSLFVDGRLPLLGLNYTRYLRELEAKSDLAALERQWRVAAAIDPEARHIAHTNLAGLLAERGEREAAALELRRALALRPDHAVAHTNLAILLAEAGRHSEAISHLRRALEIEPGLAAARANLEQLSQLVEAQPAFAQQLQAQRIAELEASLRARTDDPDATNDLAWILATHPEASLRQPERALALAQRAVALTQRGDAAALDTLAAALAGAGRFAEAVSTSAAALAAAAAPEQAPLAQEIRARLELYRKGRPYRDPALASEGRQ